MDDLRLLLEELVDVCDRWYKLGLQLKVKAETLDRIQFPSQGHVQYHDPRDELLEMLRVWLTTSDNTSWKALTNALLRVGKIQLAGSLERKYCLTKEMRESKH